MKQERQREIKRRRVLRREEIGGVKSDRKPKPNGMLLTCNSRLEDKAICAALRARTPRVRPPRVRQTPVEAEAGRSLRSRYLQKGGGISIDI